MTRHDSKDVITAFGRLTDAAEDYVNRAPRVRRIQDQRTALFGGDRRCTTRPWTTTGAGRRILACR